MGLAFPAFTQDQSQSHYSDTELATYNSFFFRVVWLEDEAGKVAVQGRDAGGIRSMIRKQAGLTAAEEAALKGVAADWNVRFSGIMTAARALMSDGARASTSPPLMALRNQRDRMIADHIDQLRSALGSDRFRLLNFFVHRPAPKGVMVAIPSK
jgi:hypothetical protein